MTCNDSYTPRDLLESQALAALVSQAVVLPLSLLLLLGAARRKRCKINTFLLQKLNTIFSKKQINMTILIIRNCPEHLAETWSRCYFHSSVSVGL